jgi:hypothetical protein
MMPVSKGNKVILGIFGASEYNVYDLYRRLMRMWDLGRARIAQLLHIVSNCNFVMLANPHRYRTSHALLYH